MKMMIMTMNTLRMMMLKLDIIRFTLIGKSLNTLSKMQYKLKQLIDLVHSHILIHVVC